MVVVKKDALCRAVEVIILPGAERPEKGKDAHETKRKRKRNEEEKRVHAAPFAGRARRAFSVTMIELADMAAAAISGVTSPKTATGIRVML